MALISAIVAIISLFIKKKEPKEVVYKKSQLYVLYFGLAIAIASLIGFYLADINIAFYFFIQYCIATIVIPASILKNDIPIKITWLQIVWYSWTLLPLTQVS